MFPLYDDNPHGQRPWVTYCLIGICVVVFLMQTGQGARTAQEMVIAFGFIPARVFTPADLPPEFAIIPGWATLISSMFMHGGWMHLGGNMLYLWIFGDNVEVAMGRLRFLAFYLLTGIAAALCHAVLDPGSRIPLVGASGAISGVLGAYILLFPRASVQVLMFPLGFVSVPAVIVLAVWFGLQLFNGFGSDSSGGGVAFWAHVGGFIAGVVLVTLFKKRDVRLFARGHHKPFEIERRGPKDGPWGPRPD
ncbi:MAG: rhomboid family intramembrane serine protease [Alphaproteobacteria bacterium]